MHCDSGVIASTSPTTQTRFPGLLSAGMRTLYSVLDTADPRTGGSVPTEPPEKAVLQ